jgi:hypothetical protein
LSIKTVVQDLETETAGDIKPHCTIEPMYPDRRLMPKHYYPEFDIDYGHWKTRKVHVGTIRLSDALPDSSSVGASSTANAVDSELTSNSVLNMPKIRSWIADCEENHGEACSKANLITSLQFPLLLTDIQEMRLVEADSSYRYIALSYVWGAVKMLKTKRANLASFKQFAGLEAPGIILPIVVQDVIRLLGGLEERYLWVDYLYIVQDNAHRKHDDLQRMDQIYAQAILTSYSSSTVWEECQQPIAWPSSWYKSTFRRTWESIRTRLVDNFTLHHGHSRLHHLRDSRLDLPGAIGVDEVFVHHRLASILPLQHWQSL